MNKPKLIIVGAVVGLVATVLLFPVVSGVLSLFGRVTSLGVWGPIVVGGAYVITCVLLIPASILTLAAGFLFGLPLGSVVALFGSTLGACAAFLVGRTFARDWVSRRVALSPRFTAIDRAVGSQGFKITLLSRLSPISPFILLNYIFGLTGISFWHYALGTLLGMIPGTVLLVYFGAGLRSLAEVAARARGGVVAGPTERTVFWLGLVLAASIAVILARLAHREIGRAMANGTEDQDAGLQH